MENQKAPLSPGESGTEAAVAVQPHLFSRKKALFISFCVGLIVLLSLAYLFVSYAAGDKGPIKALGNCLDNTYGKKVNGNPVQMYGCDGTSTQSWTLANDHTIRFGTARAKYCLDVKDASKTMKAVVHLWQCGANKSQKWTVKSDGSIVNQNSGYCLDVKSASKAKGTPVWQYSCNGSAAQKWTVPSLPSTTPVPTPTPSPSPTPTPPAPTPDPTPGGGSTPVSAMCDKIPNESGNFTMPTASNTGVPAGTQLTFNAPQGVEVTSDGWKVTKPGTVIDSKIIDVPVIIAADNVTIRNSKITVPTGTYWAIQNDGGNKNFTLRDSEVGSVGGALTGITASTGTKVCGVNAHSFENIANIEADNVIFQSNYFHAHKADPKKSDPHNDVVEIRVGRNIQILGNTLKQTNPDESWQHNTGALYVAATWGDIDELTITNNWLGGGTYTMYLVTVSAGTKANLLDVDVKNNKWYRGSSAYGPLGTQPGIKPRIWTNNTYLDNGQAIQF